MKLTERQAKDFYFCHATKFSGGALELFRLMRDMAIASISAPSHIEPPNKAAERLFNALAQRTEAVAPIITDLGKAYADDCAAMAPYIRHDAPKHVKEIALGWREDDERETP